MVIGSSTAGQTAACKLNRNGLTEGMVEHSQLSGGTCALSGQPCIGTDTSIIDSFARLNTRAHLIICEKRTGHHQNKMVSIHRNRNTQPDALES